MPKPPFHLLKLHAGGGFERLRREIRCGKLTAQRHGEAARVRGGDQLLGVGADAIFKPRAEGILGVFEGRALGADAALAVFQSAMPDGACCAFHGNFL